ncbi:alpha/beta fold hydrolase [Blastococcus sp. TF02A-26]|uniref:alpha/beta fold hydrolase n=1 Tax=Blastococcus sp. TF02A-26 TaxID=2250577 RepID=UPI000DEA4E74|nr:alpha/beta hydrolase [Blastococcus sp. TF02A-26]RBY85268.1 alpha/beta hydrolase [Blastococcus sp. TF02A-26]
MRATTAAGLALVVAGAAVAARRRAAGSKRPTAQVPPPPRGEVRTVTTEDGVDLHVEVFGAEQPVATVVLAHGYVQSSRLWAGQIRDLLEARADLRVVTYDHRGHGASGPTSRDKATIEQLARDMARVLEEVVPEGPVVLGGHSMGGMTVMALAEQRPELFGDRIAGVALVGTSSGGLDAVTYGLPAPVAKAVKKLLPILNERAVKAELAGKKRAVGALDMWLIFSGTADAADLAAATEVHRGTTAETVAAFLPTFSTHDRATALAALSDVPVLIAVGDADRLCPVEHSRTIAEALPEAELAVYPGVGHMVQMERRREVSDRLLALVDRALSRTPAV